MKIPVGMMCGGNLTTEKAPTFRGLLDNGSQLDFSGVETIQDGVWQILLGGKSSTAILEMVGMSNDDTHQKLFGLSGSLETTLDTWIQQQTLSQNETSTAIEKPTETDRSFVEFQPQPISKSARQYTPRRLVTRLREQLMRYLESSRPMIDAHLLSERRYILRHEKDGKLLAQEPFIETTPRYKTSEKSYLHLDSVPEDTTIFLDALSKQPKEYNSTEMVLYPSMYTHQASALEQYLGKGKDLIVATGTGSGKTECFLVPMLGHLYQEAKHRQASFQKRGIRAMVLYPLNALVNDQLARMRQLLGDENVAKTFRESSGTNRHPVFGMYTGRTTYPGKKNNTRDDERVAPILEYYLNLNPKLKQVLMEKGKYPAKDLEAFYAKDKEEFKLDNSGRPVLDKKCWENRLFTGPNDRELFTRQEMVRYDGKGDAPDVLITNYFMLEYMLMRPFERPLFQQTKAWLEESKENEFLLILDEAHMYRGSQGAEVAFLLRRLRARLGLTDQPERFRVICTSASLGKGEEAELMMKNFAADLVGKKPSDFESISGEREIPSGQKQGDANLLEILSTIDVEKLLDKGFSLEDTAEQQEQLSIWKDKLQSLFTYYSELSLLNGANSFETVLSALYSLLKDKPLINKLLAETAGNAKSLSVLADTLFTEGSVEEKELATQNLLSLANIARPELDSPGLIPTRVHIFFRGLEGLYACINPTCSGKVSHKEQPTTLGKLFSEPRLKCDSCQSRVFELSTCRGCGHAYINAYTLLSKYSVDKELENPPIPKMKFLFGHMVENATEVQLLVCPPEYGVMSTDAHLTPEEIKYQQNQEYLCEELHVDAFTGCIEQNQTEHTRRLWAYKMYPEGLTVSQQQKSKRIRVAKFEKCAMCNPSGSRRSSRFAKFATAGELAFTSLIETQFSEQPPQHEPTFNTPNGGRKVLIFSDGRQKAAKLAPALEYTHNRDLFRQLIVRAFYGYSQRYPNKQLRVTDLDVEILYWCVLLNVHLDMEENERWMKLYFQVKHEYGQLVSNNKNTANDGLYKYICELKKYDRDVFNSSIFAKLLFQNLTERYFSLSALGIGSVIVHDFDFRRLRYEDVEHRFNLPEADFKILLQQWLNILMERRAFLPDGIGPTDTVGENVFDKPDGIVLKIQSDVLPLKFQEYLFKLFGSGAKVQAFEDFVKNWIGNPSQTFAHVSNRDFIKEIPFKIYDRSAPKYLCTGCGRLHLERLIDTCPACASDKLTEVDKDYLESRFGYYYQQLAYLEDTEYLEPFGIVTAEHSAHLKATEQDEAFSRAEEYELRFQDILLDRTEANFNPLVSPIDILSCTTTMEVGIDIGSLCGVALRNIPPQVANYQQRAGRAGRRGTSLASVLTYAQGGSHDRHFFNHPHDIISGPVLDPIVYVENQQILVRHIHAYYIQRFFHEVVTKGTLKVTHLLFNALGDIGSFLDDKQAYSFEQFKLWLEHNRKKLHEEVLHWASDFSYSRKVELKEVTQSVATSIETLVTQLEEHLPIEKYQDYRSGLLSEEDEAKFSIVLEKKLLDMFMEKAILPRYAFPMDVVNFHVVKDVIRQKGKSKIRLDYAPDRDLQIALSEYAPGNHLTIDKRKYTSAALFDLYSEPKDMQGMQYIECPTCHFVATHIEEVPSSCPSCGEIDIQHHVMKRPIGFAADRHKKAPIDIGIGTVKFGYSTKARLVVKEKSIEDWDQSFIAGKVQIKAETKRELIVVNKGLKESGFVMCEGCGRVEPQVGRAFEESVLFKRGQPTTHRHPIFDKNCDTLVDPNKDFFLGYEFPTDLLLIRLQFSPKVSLDFAKRGSSSNAIQSALLTLVEALSQATTRVLQIDQNEIAGNYTTVVDSKSNEAYLFLYDILSGGAGYTIGIKDTFQEILQKAKDILHDCSCDVSCYDCLRHYGNQMSHHLLHRQLALDLLQNLLHEEDICVSSAKVQSSIDALVKYLTLNGWNFEQGTFLGRESIPLKIQHSNGDEKYIMIVHPLLCPDVIEGYVQELQDDFLESVIPIDWFTLEFNLPHVLETLGLADGKN